MDNLSGALNGGLSAPPDTGSGCSDELAAAAAVLAIGMGANAEEDMELDSMPGTSGDNTPQTSSTEPSSADKENEGNLPGLGGHRTTDQKVCLRS